MENDAKTKRLRKVPRADDLLRPARESQSEIIAQFKIAVT